MTYFELREKLKNYPIFCLDDVFKWFPYLVLVLVIVLPWFLRPGYLFFTDLSWGPNVVLPAWTSNWFYFWAAVKGLSFLISPDLLEKLFIAVVFGIVLFGGYKIAESLTQNKIILFLGSAFALFNPFVYDRVMYGQFGIVLAYGFFLAFFGYLIRYYFTLERRQIIFASIVAGLSILFASHFVFFVALVDLVFGILIFLKILSQKEKKKLGKIFALGLLSILIIIAINFNWLYGAFSGESKTLEFIKTKITEQDLRVFKTRGSTPFEVVKNVFLMSGFWGIEQFRYEPLQSIKENWGRSFYFLLPIIIWGFVVNFKDKEKRKLNIGLIFIFVISFVLALGIAFPVTSKITLWLFNNIPFYRGLRETQKWVAVLVAVYEILLVYGFIELFKRRIIIKYKELIIILLTGVIIFQAPLLIGGGAGQVGPVDYPKDWYEMNDFIVQKQKLSLRNQKCAERILFLPWHLYMNFKWIGNIVVNPAPSFFQCPVISGENMEFWEIYSQTLKDEQKKVQDWLSSFGQTDLLSKNELNIGYLVLAKEADWQNYLWIENHPELKLEKETENLKVYRVFSVN
jgi:hypothetical protein